MKNLKIKLLIIIFTISMFLFNSIAFCATNPPETNSKSVILMDSKTGQILYEKNSNEKLYPASITKIMTSILILEKYSDNLNTNVTASKTAINITEPGSSNIGTSEGEVMTIEQLLYGVLLQSANECSNVLAEFSEGSIEAFVNKMNEKAIQLGAKNTHFNNTNGLTDENHYTSAYDMALITQYALKNEKFREIVKTYQYTIPPTNMYVENRYLTNRNRLITNLSGKLYYEKAIGVKTGYTSAASNTLSTAAVKDDLELIAICLNAQSLQGVPQTYVDAINLFEYGFNNFKKQNIVTKDTVLKEVEIKNGKDLLSVSAKENLTILSQSQNNTSTYNYTDNISEELVAPITKGSEIGTRTYQIDGLSAVSVPLIAANDLQAKSTFSITFFLFLLLKIILVIVILFILLAIIFFIWLKLNHKQIKKKDKLKLLKENHSIDYLLNKDKQEPNDLFDL